jgi:hypothetical protein
MELWDDEEGTTEQLSESAALFPWSLPFEIGRSKTQSRAPGYPRLALSIEALKTLVLAVVSQEIADYLFGKDNGVQRRAQPSFRLPES